MIDPKPVSGTSAPAVWFRKLLEALRSQKVLAGPGLRIKQTTQGRVLELIPRGLGQGATGAQLPVIRQWAPADAVKTGDLVYRLNPGVAVPDGSMEGTQWTFQWTGDDQANSPDPFDNFTGSPNDWMQVGFAHNGGFGSQYYLAVAAPGGGTIHLAISDGMIQRIDFF